MKREIIFRGKYAEAHEWVYGHYYNNHDCGVNQDIIICFDEDRGTGKEYLINTKYLGQFTGLQDTNGVYIYEGDILFNSDRNEHAVVEFDNEKAMFITNYTESDEKYPLYISLSNLYNSIGNIHDNPELL